MFRSLLFDASSDSWLLFQNPLQTHVAYQANDVIRVLAAAEKAAIEGCHAVGFVAYEAASAFDAALTHHPAGPLPLAAFGVFREGEPFCLPQADVSIDLVPSLTEAEFNSALKKIHDYLAEGDSYQVNFTLPMRGQVMGPVEAIFARLVQAQPTPYSFMLETEDYAICSVSPELFFERQEGQLRAEPMKGTRPRGRYAEEDKAMQDSLCNSQKDQAENLMILDMVRNDLGRIAMPGTVCMTSMFDIRKYPTVWQQVSSVQAETRTDLPGVFSALFPCASVTGAPKARSMAIIRELEAGHRGIYTGATGVIKPGGDCRFSVAIRTLELNKATGLASWGVGGGIVWDSDTADEWQEAMTKAVVLTNPRPDFRLLETMRLDPKEGIFQMEEHLARLALSAEYFDFACPLADIRACLMQQQSRQPLRLRLLLDREGRLELERGEVPEMASPVRLRLAAGPVNSRDPFLFHKTTNRSVYENARRQMPDCDDVILFNERGELTETTIANLFLELDGQLKTPAVSSGLLAGTYRNRMLAQGEAVEAVLTLQDLAAAERIHVANSVRGLSEAVLVDAQEKPT